MNKKVLNGYNLEALYLYFFVALAPGKYGRSPNASPMCMVMNVRPFAMRKNVSMTVPMILQSVVTRLPKFTINALSVVNIVKTKNIVILSLLLVTLP